MKDQLIPIESIGDQFPKVEIFGIPHRQHLSINTNLLRQSLAAIDATDNPLSVNFVRDEPQVDIAPESNGPIDALTQALTVAPTKDAPQIEPVTYNPTLQTVNLRIPYRDKHSLTAKSMATHASHQLSEGLAHIPKARYQGQSQFEFGPKKELALFKTAAAFNLGSQAALAVMLASEGLGEFMIKNPELTLSTFMAEASLVHLILGTCLLASSIRARNTGELYPYGVDDLISQDLRRAFYPATLVHSLLIPATLYRLHQFTHLSSRLIDTLKPTV